MRIIGVKSGQKLSKKFSSQVRIGHRSSVLTGILRVHRISSQGQDLSFGKSPADFQFFGLPLDYDLCLPLLFDNDGFVLNPLG